MNTLVRDDLAALHEAQAIRTSLMEMVTDADLAFALPFNPTLGELCREIGEIEYAYIQSFRTFTFALDYRHPDPSIATSRDRLQTWYKELDAEFDAVIASLSDHTIQTQPIDRGGWYKTVRVQFFAYFEALLIFYAKASVYLRALQKPLPAQYLDWIG